MSSNVSASKNAWRAGGQFPESPLPWAYKRDVADGLISLRFNAQVDEHCASDVLTLFTEDLFDAFGSRPFQIWDFRRFKDREPDTNFARVFDAFEADMGGDLDSTTLEGWLELNKGVERNGKVLVRTNTPYPTWRVCEVRVHET